MQASESNIYCMRRFSALKWLEKITGLVNAVYITFLGDIAYLYRWDLSAMIPLPLLRKEAGNRRLLQTR